MNRQSGRSWEFRAGIVLALAIGVLAAFLVMKPAGRRAQPERATAATRAESPPPTPSAPAAGGPQVFVPNASVKSEGRPAGVFPLPAEAVQPSPANQPLPDPTVAATAATPPEVVKTPEDPAVTLLSAGLSEAEKKSVKESLLNFPSLYDSKTLMSMLFQIGRAHV